MPESCPRRSLFDVPSWQNAVITKLVLPLLGAKRRLSYPTRTQAAVEARALRPPSYVPPKRLDRKTLLTVRHRDGWLVYEAAPKVRAAAKQVLYLHGGAYVHEIVRQHWSLIGRLVGAVPACCVVPIYPLAPRGLASEVVPHAAGILAELIGEVGAEDVVLMGDSAGGGMALAVAEELRDRG